MRLLSVVAIVLASTSLAFAGSTKNDNSKSSGGRLGSVSSGIDRATPKPSKDPQPSRSEPSRDRGETEVVVVDSCCYASLEEPPAKPFVWPKLDVGATGFAGAQKVVESDGSLSLELSLVFSRKFRINAAVSHYFEDTMPDRRVTMNIPSLTMGVRLGPPGRTAVWIEGGVAHVATNDPAGSSSITGSLAQLRLEHQLDRKTALTATGGALLFSELQAMTARAAVRIHHVELGVRYMDFTVGPALWGPEVGIGF